MAESKRIIPDQTPIQLKEPFVRLDGERGKGIEFDPKTLKTDIDSRGVPLVAQGHCKIVRPLVDPEAADQIENPYLRKPLQASSWLLNKLHTGISYLYAGVAKIDEYTFEKGLDRATGLNEVEGNTQQHLRWGERAAAFTVGTMAYQGVKTRSLKGALQGTKTFVGKTWPIGAVLYLSQTKIASNLEEKGAAIGVAALGGAALMLNLPAGKGYRRVVGGTGQPMALKWGLLFALSHFGLNYFWDNMSSQQRLLPILHNQPSSDGYKPWKWDTDLLQANTTIAHSIGWGLFGSAWGSLLKVQHQGADWVTKKLFGFGEEVQTIVPGSPAHRFIHGGFLGRWAPTRGLKAFLTTFRPKPLTVTAFSTIIGLPLGIGLSRLQFEAQDFSSMTAVTGTPARAIITSPLATAGIAACTAMFGVAHPWCAYAFNMYPVNWEAQACSQQGEIIYQVEKKLVQEYQNMEETSPRKKRLASMIFNLHRAAYDNGNTKPEENEKLKIAALLTENGFDVAAMEESAIRYASPAAE